jgi:hypothetical protein
MLVKDLKFLEDELEWKYNIPRSLRFVYNKVENCKICSNSEVNDWIDPYVVAGVPFSELKNILKEHFLFEIEENDIDGHKNHIKTKFYGDDEIKNNIIEQIKQIESDIPRVIDEKQVLESSIRSLYARKLYLEKIGEYGFEYKTIVSQLKNFLELKLKMKGELVDENVRVSIADLVKLGEINESKSTKFKGNESTDPGDGP